MCSSGPFLTSSPPDPWPKSGRCPGPPRRGVRLPCPAEAAQRRWRMPDRVLSRRPASSRALTTCLLQELGHERRPTCLMARAKPGARVAMEVFVKKEQVAPLRAALSALVDAVHGPRAVGAFQEQAGEPARQFGGDLPQREQVAGPGWAFHFEVVAVIVMKSLQRFDQQVIDGEPDGAAPVRVSAEGRAPRLRGVV